MDSDFPKLLVATEFPPNAAGGGAAVLRQMLKEIQPNEQLFCGVACLDSGGSFYASNHSLS